MNQLKFGLLIGVFFINVSLFGQVISEPICIGEKFVIKSDILNQEREIFIALPENYGNPDLKFPTHYVLDGEIIFSSYSSIVELKSQNGEIPEAIIIGIPNIDRSFDLNPKENGINFLTFITKELVPYIDKNYNTTEKRILIGYSMAGNFVIYTLLDGQDSFTMFLSGSPYRLDMYKNDQIDSFIDDLNSKRILYTSMGSEDRANQLETFKTFCKQIEKKEYRSNKNFKFEIAKNRDHNNNFLINWQDGLDYLFKDWNYEKKID